MPIGNRSVSKKNGFLPDHCSNQGTLSALPHSNYLKIGLSIFTIYIERARCFAFRYFLTVLMPPFSTLHLIGPSLKGLSERYQNTYPFVTQLSLKGSTINHV